MEKNMTYEEFLVSLSDTTPQRACDILCENPNHEHKKAYELIISKDAICSYYYAIKVIKGRFESGENSISKVAYYSYHYALNVIRGRFELGEETIKKSKYKKYYATNIMKDLNFWKNQ